MIKCEVIKEFTLERYNELKNIQRRRIETKGKLYVGDTFECDKEMADYLMGDNKNGDVVVKVIEVEPETKMPEIKIKENEINITADTITFTDKDNNKHTIKKKKHSKK